MYFGAHCALTHVASQLLYRWLQPPVLAPQAELLSMTMPALQDLSEDDWLDLLALDRSHKEPCLTWFERYKKRFDHDGVFLVRQLRQHLSALQVAGGVYTPLGDARYPEFLRHIADPPIALSMIGDLRLLHKQAISIVGSRKASALAVHASFELGRALAERGYLVVSGGAFGCDIAAHHGVLAAVGQPAAAACVFAGGLSDLYPHAHREVFRRLRSRGALLISERLWTANCRPMDFMARNRIISGLGATTVLMQAAVRSGALVTARLALDQGREVAVLRHPFGDVRANGSAALLADGAWGFADAAEFCLALERRAVPVPSADF